MLKIALYRQKHDNVSIIRLIDKQIKLFNSLRDQAVEEESNIDEASGKLRRLEQTLVRLKTIQYETYLA